MQPEKSTSPSTKRVLHVETSDAIAFITDTEAIQWLLPFMRGERNLASVSAELSVDLSLLSRRVQRMIRLKFIEVSRSERRKGRAIRYYHAVADEFFVPERTGAVLKMLAQSDRLYNQTLQRGILEEWMVRDETSDSEWGLRIYSSGERMHITGAVRPGQSWNPLTSSVRAAAYWRHPKLSAEDAQWLKAEIDHLSDELQARHCEDGTAFLVRLAFAPIDES